MRKLLVLPLLALLVGCWPQPPDLSPQPCGAEGPADVVLFGDSLSAMARTSACERFATAGLSVSYNAVSGTQLDHWLDAMANVPDGVPVVVALGTNDVSNDLIVDTAADLSTVLDTLAGHCVVVPTLNTTGGDLRPWPFGVRTHAFNAELTTQLALRPDVVGYDWDAIASGHTEWLMGTTVSPADWLHHNAVGNEHYAQMLVDAAGTC